MNLKRGLLRCWIVFAVAFVLLTALFTANDIRRDFWRASLMRSMEEASLLIPVLVLETDARGVPEDCKTDPLRRYTIAMRCWYDLPRFRALFPEYRDISDEDLVEKTYAEAGVQRADVNPIPK